MDLKTIIERLREQEAERKKNELASLKTNVNVFKNKAPSSTQSNVINSTAKSGADVGNNPAKTTKNTDAIDRDWGVNTQTYAYMTDKLKKVNINKSADMINNDYDFNVKAMDDYLTKMKSNANTGAKVGAGIYEDIADKMKYDKYADTMMKVGKSFAKFGKFNPLNGLYYINNQNNKDGGYKYISKDDMNRYYYLLASHEKGDTNKKDVDDLADYLFSIGEPIDRKEADELPEIEPDYSKVLDTEQYLDSEYEKALNKANNIDYSKIPSNDQFVDEPGKINKSTEAIDRDYGIDIKLLDKLEKEWSEKQNKRQEIAKDYYNKLDMIIANDIHGQDLIELGRQGSNFGEYNPLSDPDYAFNNYNITYATEAVKCISKNDINKYYYMRGLYKKGLIDEQILMDFENHLYTVGGQIYENNRKRTEQAKGKLNYDKKPVYYFQSGVRGIENPANKVLQLLDYYIGNKVAPQVKSAESTAFNESKIRVSEEQKEMGNKIYSEIQNWMPWNELSAFSDAFFYYKSIGYTENKAFIQALKYINSDISSKDMYDANKKLRNIYKK